MRTARLLAAGVALVVALVLQMSVFAAIGWHGIAPNMVLLVVVAGALTRGASFGMVLGFCGGALLDLAPPAAHLAGQWTLALVFVGYFASRVRSDSVPARAALWGTVAASSFIGTSVFALLSLLTGDEAFTIPVMLSVIAVSVLSDVLVSLLVLRPLMAMFRRLAPVQTRTA